MSLTTLLSNLFGTRRATPKEPELKHGESGWFTVTQIGMQVGRTAHQVNHFLDYHGFQYRTKDGVWRLTHAGKRFGEEYIFEAVNKHQEIRIRWRPSIMDASGMIWPIVEPEGVAS